jgi:hypothetical protein
VHLQLQRTEDVRAHAQQLAMAGESPDGALRAAAVDQVAATTAWASFVPFLAHPVMADMARGGMEVLERTVDPAHPLVA